LLQPNYGKFKAEDKPGLLRCSGIRCLSIRLFYKARRQTRSYRAFRSWSCPLRPRISDRGLDGSAVPGLVDI